MLTFGRWQSELLAYVLRRGSSGIRVNSLERWRVKLHIQLDEAATAVSCLPAAAAAALAYPSTVIVLAPCSEDQAVRAVWSDRERV